MREGIAVLLGTCVDGRALEYDEARFAFSLAGNDASYGEVLSLDDEGSVRWRALGQRDWFRRIDRVALEEAREEALAREEADRGRLDPHRQVLADAAEDDGILAGRIVEADPSLVQAVARSLVEQGLVPAGESSAPQGNPLAEMDLPEGLEALAQMERAKGSKRPMTRSERRLARRILKNDDKQKARRERDARRNDPESAQGDGAEREDV